MRRSPRWIGIDLGASAIHTVALVEDAGPRPTVGATHTYASTDLTALVGMAAGSDGIAIDAPDELSTAPHGGTAGLVAPKFIEARCAEIALGQLAGIWVPWTTPVSNDAAAAWMKVGFDVWAALRAGGHQPIEVYPYGVFRILAGGRIAPKTTTAGRLARIDLLEPHVELPAGIARWSHDWIDALAAALVVCWRSHGRARGIGHTGPGCDASAIWLPGAA